MKVLIIAYGMKDYWTTLAMGLSKKCELHILTSKRAKENILVETLRKKYNVKMHYTSDFPFNFDFYKKILKIQPNIVHLTGGWPKNKTFIHILENLSRIPIVTTIHQPSIKRGQPNVKGYPEYVVKKFRIKNTYNFSGGIIFTSKKEMQKHMKKVRGLSFAIPLGAYTIRTLLTSKSSKEEKNTIIFFGNFTESYKGFKGLRYLIKAEPKIKREIPNLNIIVAGKGNFGKFSDIIKNKKSFEIHDEFIPQRKVSKLFGRVKICIMPYISKYTAKSGVLSTAYAFNKPVISSNVGSLNETINNNKTGILVEPENPNMLANEIIKLLKNKNKLKKMKKYVKKKVNNELSPEVIGEKTISAYIKTINND